MKKVVNPIDKWDFPTFAHGSRELKGLKIFNELGQPLTVEYYAKNEYLEIYIQEIHQPETEEAS